jgi:ketosteroid isomerase-like protein
MTDRLAGSVRSDDARVQRIIERFETLTEADLPLLVALYTPDARFKDPFNEVQGTAAISAIFAHMFHNLDAPRFVIRDVVVQGSQCFLSWDFLFSMRRFSRAPQCIRGGSHLRLAADGRIAEHRDYWDAAEELYEKLPVVGALMRWLKRRAAS